MPEFESPAADRRVHRPDAREVVREIVLRMAPAPASPATDPDLVEELGYHSLALLEMAFELEDEFGLPQIDQKQAEEIRTLGDVQDYVIGELAKRSDRSR